jgi:hypothetical protein
MTSGAGTRAALAAALALALALGACGFSDTLTSRGFVQEGDRICVDTLVRTGAGFSRGEVPPPQFLGALAGAYRQAASRFGRLDVRSEDEEMRDSVVRAYSSFANRLQSAASAAATGAANPDNRVFADISAQQRQMKAYGFDVCGGGGG